MGVAKTPQVTQLYSQVLPNFVHPNHLATTIKYRFCFNRPGEGAEILQF